MKTCFAAMLLLLLVFVCQEVYCEWRGREGGWESGMHFSKEDIQCSGQLGVYSRLKLSANLSPFEALI